MDEQSKKFVSEESAKLSEWLSRTLAVKESKNFTGDLAASTQRNSGPTIEVNASPTVIEPQKLPPPKLEASISAAGDYATEEWVLEQLEDYATKEWVEEQLEGYATEEWVEDQGYATEEWVEDKGYATEEWVEDKDYATKEWVEDKLSNFVTKDELSKYVLKENLVSDWWSQMFATDTWKDLQRQIIRSDLFDCNINNALGSLKIEANCEGGQVTVTLSHERFSANEC